MKKVSILLLTICVSISIFSQKKGKEPKSDLAKVNLSEGKHYLAKGTILLRMPIIKSISKGVPGVKVSKLSFKMFSSFALSNLSSSSYYAA